MSRIQLKNEASGELRRRAQVEIPPEEVVALDTAELRHVVVQPDGRITAVYKRGHMEDGAFHAIEDFHETIHDQDLAEKVIRKAQRAVERSGQ